MAPPAVAGVESLADAGVASMADAGVASLADAGVASLADAGVASLADSAEVVSSADFGESVAVGVTFVADQVGVVTKEITAGMGMVLWMVRFATVVTVAMGAWIIGMMKIRMIGVVAPMGRFRSTRSMLPGRCYHR